MGPTPERPVGVELPADGQAPPRAYVESLAYRGRGNVRTGRRGPTIARGSQAPAQIDLLTGQARARYARW